MPVILAYDGSINGDWISRYAIRLASHHSDHALRLCRVVDGAPADDVAAGKIARIAGECDKAGVAFEAVTLPSTGDVFSTLVGHIPEGPETFVVCGARVRGGGRGFLAGTVSERLLRHRRFNVMALRVVQPGLLGAPRNILLPLSGDADTVMAALPFLRLLAPGVEHIHLLRVMEVGALTLRRMDAARVARLREQGWIFLRQVAAQLAAATGHDEYLFDGSVSVAADWVTEIVVTAGRRRSGLICMEAPRQALPVARRDDNVLERVLRTTPSDVGIYRGIG